MAKSTDARVKAASLYFLPVKNRIPLKFGGETLTSVTCARARARVESRDGRSAIGWGETPLSVQWVWPSALPYEERHDCLAEFCKELTRAWTEFDRCGHPLEVGEQFLREALPEILRRFNERRKGREPMPWLAALVCCSVFDLALADAYGVLHDVSVYETYSDRHLSSDLDSFMKPAGDSSISFKGRRPNEFLTTRVSRMPAWHLVGGKDRVAPEELDGSEPDDGYPVLLRDWIRRDGLKCLKVKLAGNDSAWDYQRLLSVGRIAIDEGALWLTADFNCTVTDPDYVNAILDRLKWDAPRVYGMILYVEQPFPYELEAHQIDVRSVSARKPLFMDESAHDWRMLELGRRLGWTGVALKTCKTQTEAILSLCWAKAHGMTLMVQDLTNPMLAQISHVQLAAHAGTIMGVETNSMQFYPEASRAEEAAHPGLFKRRGGEVDASTASGPGFGYCIGSIHRELPPPAAEAGTG